MGTIPVYYGAEMLADSDSRSPSARKPEPVVRAWREAGLPIEMRPIVPATVEQLCSAHEPAFVRGVLACELENGFGNRRQEVAASLPYTNGAMICAAEAALEEGIACAPTAGFHHAEYATAAMFCTFNGLMVAALQVLSSWAAKKVLVLDCDYHFGNGTEDIIARLDLAEKVENASFGRWYRSKSHARLYLEELQRTTARFGDFDLILYQAGADVHVDDPLGGVLDSRHMRIRDRMVFEAAQKAHVPLAWNLAGGYQTPVSKVVQLHVATMEECVAAFA
jgi:acetoin utilization deacetylase AcuC-like enzyme